jgi:hypothetical protein
MYSVSARHGRKGQCRKRQVLQHPVNGKRIGIHEMIWSRDDVLTCSYMRDLNCSSWQTKCYFPNLYLYISNSTRLPLNSCNTSLEENNKDSYHTHWSFITERIMTSVIKIPISHSRNHELHLAPVPQTRGTYTFERHDNIPVDYKEYAYLLSMVNAREGRVIHRGRNGNPTRQK